MQSLTPKNTLYLQNTVSATASCSFHPVVPPVASEKGGPWIAAPPFLGPHSLRALDSLSPFWLPVLALVLCHTPLPVGPLSSTGFWALLGGEAGFLDNHGWGEQGNQGEKEADIPAAEGLEGAYAIPAAL